MPTGMTTAPSSRQAIACSTTGMPSLTCRAYRRVEYKTDGINDKFIAQADGSYKNQELNINEKYNFFNPKAGISFNKDGHQGIRICRAYSNREPERNNFTDNFNYPFPKEEKVARCRVRLSVSGRQLACRRQLLLYGL